MFRPTLLLLTFTSALAQISFPGQSTKTCITKENKLGECKPIMECPKALEDIKKRGVYPTVCAFTSSSLTICCEEVETVTTTEKPLPEPLKDYFAKFNDKCGIRSTVSTFFPTNLFLESSSPIRLTRAVEIPLPEFKPELIKPEVVGGENAERNAWPWMVLLGRGTGSLISWFCGGALISDQHVITAAHCFTSIRKPDVVRLAEHDLDKSSESDHIDAEVSTVFRHPKYAPPVIHHDIAIVKLKTPVTFTQTVAPVCMPKGLVTPDSIEVTGTITGWGTTSFGGRTSSILQQVSVPIVNKTACETSYKTLSGFSSSFPRDFPDSLFCAAEEGGGKDACQGDSGGPFMVVKNRRYSVEGIVSAGQGCGAKAFPGLYTWVYPYMSWIQSVVNE